MFDLRRYMLLRRFISVFFAFCLLAGTGSHLFAESFQLSFRIGSFSVDTTYNSNARACTRIRGALEGSARVLVKSYSSPDGSLSRNRQLSRLRAASVREFVLSCSPSSQVETVTVDEDWDGVLKYVKRSNKEWKQEAIDILTSTGTDKEALLKDLWVGEAWDDLLRNCFPTLRRVSVELVTDASEPVSSDYPIVFSQSSSRVPGSSLSYIKNMASAGASTLYIYIKASPEGTSEGNQALSLKRASRLDALLRQYGYSGEVKTKYLGEDWDGLAEAVKSASDMPDKDSVLDILEDSSLDRAARKKALQALSYGRTWLRLMDEEMSGLRRAVISTEIL